nr:L-fucose kinase-like [Cherax quadricarinatus]
MTQVCAEWMESGHAEDLIRAARHYERASQIVISQQINKKKPIGARVCFIPEFHIVCVLRDWSGGDVHLTWSELDELRDYDNPIAPGALVKTVLLYCQLLDLTSEESLATQLKQRYDGGLEVEVWSHLPQGSGLGGSSLLAGTLLSAIVVLLGHPAPRPSHLIHATLCIEQWLTTGGGWQDQVGGLVGGGKLGVSSQGTPVTVSTYNIPLSHTFVTSINQHLLLLYTGKVSKLMTTLQEHCLGMSLAGAGGGGYLYALKARPGPLADSVDLGDLTSDCVEVDQEGLELWVAGEAVTRATEDEDVLNHETLMALLETKNKRFL